MFPPIFPPEFLLLYNERHQEKYSDFILREITPIVVSSHLFNNVKWLETAEVKEIYYLLCDSDINCIDIL